MLIRFHSEGNFRAELLAKMPRILTLTAVFVLWLLRSVSTPVVSPLYQLPATWDSVIQMTVTGIMCRLPLLD